MLSLVTGHVNYRDCDQKDVSLMQKKVISLLAITALVTFFFAGQGWADIPAPPANQLLGIDDGIFNDLSEAECRACHDNPENIDRHHLLYDEPIQEGACSVNGNTCISDVECDPDICEFGYPLANDPFTCTEDIDCPDFNQGETCGEVCVGETAAPNTDTDGDGTPDTVYSCLSCHEESTAGGVIIFLVIRDCLQCHIQAPGEASVHHLTATAQGTLPPEDNIGDPDVGDCTPCHGTLVDDIGDGHDIPTYAPSEVTPEPSTRSLVCSDTEDPCVVNSDCTAPATCIIVATPGGCNFCHASGTGDPADPGTDTETGTLVYGNNITHHSAGVHKSRTGGSNTNACDWCHPPGLHGNKMRVCEGCHGYESLHNIQVDSDGSGDIVVGGELPGYGHVGADDPGEDSDCWGCHGFTSTAASTVSGPITPFITDKDVGTMTAGTETSITLTGTAFTNITIDENNTITEFQSDVFLTASDGSTSMLAPDTITESSLTFTIPGTTAPGNYTLQAVKDASSASNPIPLNINPAVVISEIDCSKCLGTMTIAGSGFSVKPGGTDEDLYVIEGDGGRLLKVVSWTDTEIKVLDARCRGDLTVNALFGSATRNQ